MYTLSTMQDWKTSLSGTLSLLITVGVAILGIGSPLVSPKVTSCLILACGVGKAVVGWLSKDAGTVLAQTPTGVKVVDSHEVPDSKDAVAVPESK